MAVWRRPPSETVHWVPEPWDGAPVKVEPTVWLVWIVEQVLDNDESYILGVFETEAAAERCRIDYPKPPGHKFRGVVAVEVAGGDAHAELSLARSILRKAIAEYGFAWLDTSRSDRGIFDAGIDLTEAETAFLDQEADAVRLSTGRRAR